MRKIEEQMIQAIRDVAAHKRQSWRQGNTVVTQKPNAIIVALHGNTIAVLHKVHNTLELTDKGNNTQVTRSRLNALGKTFGKDFGKWKSEKGQAVVLNIYGYDVGSKSLTRYNGTRTTRALFIIKGLENE